MLNETQVHRQILIDLLSHYLEPMTGNYQRLAYLAGLCDSSSGRYAHDRLAAVYGPEPVNAALTKCHEELFERLLELPLAQQEEELRAFLGTLPGESESNLNWLRADAPRWIPAQAPGYLKELFCSNLAALHQLLREKPPKAR